MKWFCLVGLLVLIPVVFADERATGILSDGSCTGESAVYNDSGFYYARAETFNISAAYNNLTVDKLTLRVAVSGAPTENFYIYMYESNSSAPVTMINRTTAEVTMLDTAYLWVNYSVTPFVLNSSKHYAFAINGSEYTSEDYLKMRLCGGLDGQNNVYPQGRYSQMVAMHAPIWQVISEDTDMVFQIWSNDTLVVETEAPIGSGGGDSAEGKTFADVLKEVFIEGKGGMGRVLVAYNPDVAPLVLEQWYVLWQERNFPFFFQNLWKLVKLTIQYVGRQPASLVEVPL